MLARLSQVIYWASCAAVMIWSSVAFAADKSTTVLGAGVTSCGTWTEHRQSDDMSAYMADVNWVLGYLTAINDASDIDVSDGTDIAGLRAWIDNYCQANPLQPIYQAANALAGERLTATKRPAN